MHDSRKVFLLPEEPRCILASYQPKPNGQDYEPEDIGDGDYSLKELKTFDVDTKPGDYVVVPTGTRHRMTVMRVEFVDMEPDLNSDKEMLWAVGRVDKTSHDDILRKEREFIQQARAAERKRQKEQLRKDFLAEMDTSNVAIGHHVEAEPTPAE